MVPKPEPLKRARGRKKRHEAKVKKDIRAIVALRDGYCRVGRLMLSGENCDGLSQWAHFGEGRRSKTRGMAPERRHRTEWTLMLCLRHHQLEESHRIRITPLTGNGADGLLRFTFADGRMVEERAV